jgi:hypothetical protein
LGKQARAKRRRLARTKIVPTCFVLIDRNAPFSGHPVLNTKEDCASMVGCDLLTAQSDRVGSWYGCYMVLQLTLSRRNCVYDVLQEVYWTRW